MTAVWLDIQAVPVQVHGFGALVVWDNVLPILCQCSAWAMDPQPVAVAASVLYNELNFAALTAPALAIKLAIMGGKAAIDGVM